MKIFTISLFSTMFLTAAAMAFDLPSAPSIDTKEAQMKACMLQEAQQALAKGALTKDNVDTQAAQIAASCASKNAVSNNSATIQLATTVIKGLLK